MEPNQRICRVTNNNSILSKWVSPKSSFHLVRIVQSTANVYFTAINSSIYSTEVTTWVEYFLMSKVYKKVIHPWKHECWWQIQCTRSNSVHTQQCSDSLRNLGSATGLRWWTSFDYHFLYLRSKIKFLLKYILLSHQDKCQRIGQNPSNDSSPCFRTCFSLYDPSQILVDKRFV